jgi:hypothetical protein
MVSGPRVQPFFLFVCLFLVGLRFELRASPLLGRCSTTWVTSLAGVQHFDKRILICFCFFALFYFEMGSHVGGITQVLGACFASVKPWVQTPFPPKKKKKSLLRWGPPYVDRAAFECLGWVILQTWPPKKLGLQACTTVLDWICFHR